MRAGIVTFVGGLALYVAAAVAQRRKGLTSGQVADAVVDRLWPTQEEEASG